MTPQEWDAVGMPGESAGTLNLLLELVPALNRALAKARAQGLTVHTSLDDDTNTWNVWLRYKGMQLLINK